MRWEIRDPWGVPTETWTRRLGEPWKISVQVLPERIDVTILSSLSGNTCSR